MEHFGKKFQAGQIASWKDRYTNYADLKSYIKEQSTSNNAQMNKNELISSFTSKLDKELKKVYMFFVQNERELYIQINSRLHLRKGYYSLDGNGIEKEFDELIKIANYTTDLTKYISDNVMAFVKILDKFDKKFHNINTNLSSTYIVEKLEMKNSDLLYIFQFKIIDEVSALLEDLQNDLLAVFSKLNPSGNNQPELQQNLINSLREKIKGEMAVGVPGAPEAVDENLEKLLGVILKYSIKNLNKTQRKNSRHCCQINLFCIFLSINKIFNLHLPIFEIII